MLEILESAFLSVITSWLVWFIIIVLILMDYKKGEIWSNVSGAAILFLCFFIVTLGWTVVAAVVA